MNIQSCYSLHCNLLDKLSHNLLNFRDLTNGMTNSFKETADFANMQLEAFQLSLSEIILLMKLPAGPTNPI